MNAIYNAGSQRNGSRGAFAERIRLVGNLSAGRGHRNEVRSAKSAWRRHLTVNVCRTLNRSNCLGERGLLTAFIRLTFAEERGQVEFC